MLEASEAQEITERIKREKQQELAKRASSPTARKIFVGWQVGTVLKVKDLEVLAERNGFSWKYVGVIASALVKGGYVERTKTGHYKLLANPSG